MSVLWTSLIMKHIDEMHWGDGFPSRVQKDEMKNHVIKQRQTIEAFLGLYELQFRRGRDKEKP